MVEIGLRAVAQFPLTWIVSRFGRPSRYENPEEPAPSEPPPTSRFDEGQRIIGEHAADLREMIKKLHCRLSEAPKKGPNVGGHARGEVVCQVPSTHS
jgi:hypothetical protein